MPFNLFLLTWGNSRCPLSSNGNSVYRHHISVAPSNRGWFVVWAVGGHASLRSSPGLLVGCIVHSVVMYILVHVWQRSSVDAVPVAECRVGHGSRALFLFPYGTLDVFCVLHRCCFSSAMANLDWSITNLNYNYLHASLCGTYNLK